MMMKTKTVTLRQILQAIRDHPLPKYHGGEFFLFEDDYDGIIVEADALGNAAIALSVDANELYEAITDVDRDDPLFGDYIAELSDSPNNYSLEQVADYAAAQFAMHLDDTFEVRAHVVYNKTPTGYKKDFKV